ncbi:pentapeptide repeat-containing protein [Nocardia niigatensis]
MGRWIGKAFVWDGWLKIGAAATALGVAGTFYVSSHTLQATNVQNDATKRVAVTDQFSKAVAALDSSGVNSRIGGVFSLEQLAVNYPDVRDPTISVLSSFINARAHVDDIDQCTSAPVGADIVAAFVVVGRRTFPLTRPFRIDHVCLRGLQLTGALLKGATFSNVDLSEAYLGGVDLTNAAFLATNLHSTYLASARLVGAQIAASQAEATIFSGSDLALACIVATKLDSAIFGPSSLVAQPAVNLAFATLQQDSHDKATWPNGFAVPASIDQPVVAPLPCHR